MELEIFLSAPVDVQCDMNIGHIPLYLYLIVTYSICWGDFLKNSWDKAQSRRPIPQCQRFIIQTDMHVRVHTITQRTTSNFIMQTDKAKLWSCRQWKLRMNLRPKRILRITQNPSKTQSCHPTNLYRSVCEFVCVTTAFPCGQSNIDTIVTDWAPCDMEVLTGSTPVGLVRPQQTSVAYTHTHRTWRDILRILATMWDPQRINNAAPLTTGGIKLLAPSHSIILSLSLFLAFLFLVLPLFDTSISAHFVTHSSATAWEWSVN